MKLMKSKILLSFLMIALSGCASKDVDLESSPYTQAAAIKDMGGAYKIGNPYKIMGLEYTPKEDYSYSEEGTASWYGEDFHAKKTANGEDYDMNTLTAAHRTLPLPSIVKVTNLDNGRSLVLRVNDRGPYAKNRIIDISKRGAQLLGFQAQGTAKVRVEVMPKESIALKQALLNQDFEPNYALFNARSEALIVPPNAGPAPMASSATIPVKKDALMSEDLVVAEASASSAVIKEDIGGSAVDDANLAPLEADELAFEPAPIKKERVVTTARAAGGKKFFVQAGAFSKETSAQQLSMQLKNVGTVVLSQANVNGNPFYRVRLGPYNAEDEASMAMDKLRDYGIDDARIVKD